MKIPIDSFKALSQIQHYYGFKYLLNPKVHEQILDKIKLENTYKNTHELKVLDLYPGPGQHAAIFYNRYQPKQYGLMESRADFSNYLKSKFEKTPLELFNKDPYEWTSYTDLIDDSKCFVPEKEPLDHINTKFLIMANLTNQTHEALLMQWFACIGNRNWLQRFGRIKMLLWVPTQAAAKLLATPGSLIRSKCSVVREAFTDTKLVALSNTKDQHMFNSKFLEKCDPIVFSNLDIWQSRDKGIALLEVDPNKHDIDLDTWDYVTKHLLILKKTPLLDSIDSLGHGAKEYFTGTITDKEIFKKCPGELTNEEFLYLTDLFNKWPFRPDIYMDFVDVYQENSFM